MANNKDDKNEFIQMIPLPSSTLKNLLSDSSYEKLFDRKQKFKLTLKNNNFNFSLFSPRFVFWKIDEKKMDFKNDEDTIENLKSIGNSVFGTPNLKNLILRKNERLDSFLASLKQQNIQVFSFTSSTTSPFITGLGSGHPTETAITLDRNLGIPYIPSSSIKGVLRLAKAINIANNRDENYEGDRYEVDDKELAPYFGYQDPKNIDISNKGKLLILDAYPKTAITLDTDIINPHYASYYDGEGKEAPTEFTNPKPKKFLVVPKGETFVFRCAYMPSSPDDKCDENDIIQMFNTAFTDVGFGSKTAIGYGRFSPIVHI